MDPPARPRRWCDAGTPKAASGARRAGTGTGTGTGGRGRTDADTDADAGAALTRRGSGPILKLFHADN